MSNNSNIVEVQSKIVEKPIIIKPQKPKPVKNEDPKEKKREEKKQKLLNKKVKKLKQRKQEPFKKAKQLTKITPSTDPSTEKLFKTPQVTKNK